MARGATIYRTQLELSLVDRVRGINPPAGPFQFCPRGPYLLAPQHGDVGHRPGTALQQRR